MRCVSRIVPVIFALCMAAPSLAAQKLGWSGQSEANASLFFGNTRQWLAAAHSLLVHRDSAVEVKGEAHGTYAQTATDTGASIVSARSWLVSMGATFQPFARWSPFLLTSAEASLEQHIDRRYSAGLGAKYTLERSDSTQVDFSVAALGEYTRPLEGAADTMRAGSRLRLSARSRFQRKIGDRMHFTQESWYQPSASDFSHFTLNTSTVLAVNINATLAATLTLQDVYDSEARRRGAHSNNDGQFLVGLRAGY